jgi:hypothetical protein
MTFQTCNILDMNPSGESVDEVESGDGGDRSHCQSGWFSILVCVVFHDSILRSLIVVTLDHLRGEVDEYAKAKASKITNEDIPAVMQTSFLIKTISRLKNCFAQVVSIPSHLVYQ